MSGFRNEPVSGNNVPPTIPPGAVAADDDIDNDEIRRDGAKEDNAFAAVGTAVTALAAGATVAAALGSVMWESATILPFLFSRSVSIALCLSAVSLEMELYMSEVAPSLSSDEERDEDEEEEKDKEEEEEDEGCDDEAEGKIRATVRDIMLESRTIRAVGSGGNNDS